LTSSDAQLIGNAVLANTASGSGGGLCLVGDEGVRLDRNSFTDNTATYGGGVYVGFSGITLTNNLVVDNYADSTASGLYFFASRPHLLHTTIARNRGGDGSGAHFAYYNTAFLTNTILVSQTVGIKMVEFNTVTLEATLWGTATWANETDWVVNGVLITGTVNLWQEPGFVDPDTGDYHIRLDSAAVDVGVDGGVTVDIDGDIRPFGAGCDIGADEAIRRVYVPVILRATP
jgi:hypothetical protein